MLFMQHGHKNTANQGQFCNIEMIFHTAAYRRASLLNNHTIQLHEKLTIIEQTVFSERTSSYGINLPVDASLWPLAVRAIVICV